MATSETDTCRERLGPYCSGNGLDIGSGGSPINKTAICIDRDEQSRSHIGSEPVHLVWDAFGVLPFKDNTLDYIFSSHCLEDARDTRSVLIEWFRMVKPGGKIILFLPNQSAYEARCQRDGTESNGDHIHKDFSLEFVKARLPENCAVIHEAYPVDGNDCSFELVLEKRTD